MARVAATPESAVVDHRALRLATEAALEGLARGLAAETANRPHIEGLRASEETLERLHDRIARSILQALVLAAAAAVPAGAIPLVHPPNASPAAAAARARFSRCFGVPTLHAMAVDGRVHDGVALWRLFREIGLALGGDPAAAACRRRFALAAIGGWLWRPHPDDDAAWRRLELADAAFLRAIRPLLEAIVPAMGTPGGIGHRELGIVLSQLLDRRLAPGVGDSIVVEAASRRRRLGSHFTPPRLVEHLLASALDPLIEEACGGSDGDVAAQRIAEITLCDPAAGVGHLLVPAARRLAVAIERVRDAGPRPPAMPEVLRRCIHGVERDPLTIAVCEASLWLEAASPGVPMAVAVPGLRLGDSLLGADPAMLDDGLPAAVLATREGDDPAIAADLRRRERRERRHDPRPVAAARPRFSPLAADACCAAFFWRKRDGHSSGEADLASAFPRGIASRPADFAAGTPLRNEIDRLAALHRFLHPHLAFPEVFAGRGEEAPGGFSAVIGNPPFLNRLGKDTVASPAAAALLRHRTAGAVRGYADAAAAFLLIWSRLLRPGGRLAMVQPQSLLGARDTAPVRQALLRHAGLASLWVAGEPVFEGTSVLTCVPTLVAGASPSTIVRHRGGEVRRIDDLPIDAASLRAAPAWSHLAIDDAVIPRIEVAADRLLGEIANASADFRDEYYALANAIFEGGPSAEEEAAFPPILTSGLVDLAFCRWGERPTRLHRARWLAPRLRPDRLDDRHRDWLARRLVPKVVLATQTRVLEALVDAAGRFVPCTPLISIVPHRLEDLWRVAAVAASPASTLRLRREHAGTALSDDAIKPTAAAVRMLPLPRDRRRWDLAAKGLRDAHTADTSQSRAECIARFAREASLAAVPDPAEATRLATWWLARFAAAFSPSRRDGAAGQR